MRPAGDATYRSYLGSDSAHPDSIRRKMGMSNRRIATWFEGPLRFGNGLSVGVWVICVLLGFDCYSWVLDDSTALI
jgi:hypothetical protein